MKNLVAFEKTEKGEGNKHNNNKMNKEDKKVYLLLIKMKRGELYLVE